MRATAQKSKPNVREVDPDLIDYDPSNPRGDSPEDIESDPEFARLQDSVRQYGVMVPLVVMESEAQPDRYRLVDGERRLRAALSVNADEVPVRIVSGDTADALAQSFHIHSLRKEWSPDAYAKATKTLIKQLEGEEPGITKNETAVRKRVSERTGLTGMDLRRAVRIALRYSEKEIEAIRRGEPDISYINEAEERFIDQLDRRFPGLLKRLGEQAARRMMMEKARRGLLGDAQGIRSLGDLIATVLERPQRASLEKLVERFLKQDDLSVAEVVSTFRERFPQGSDDVLELAERVKADAKTLRSALKKLELSDLRKRYSAAATALVRTLKSLQKTIDRVLMPKRG